MKLKEIRIDGYKNLIDCRLKLGDFNVLVGPNNCGKSNLLEAIQMLWPICFGDEKLRKMVFWGLTPPGRFAVSVCHLEKCANKPLTIGIAFEIEIGSELWKADYEVKIQCGEKETKDIGFIRETLAAKQPSKTGKATRYISRTSKTLKVVGKKPRAIAKDNSSLLAIQSLYPNFEGLPPELKVFVRCINNVANTEIFAISPKGLRERVDEEKSIEGPLISSFDLSLIADHIKEEGKYYELFRERLCDILDLEDVDFQARLVPARLKKGKAEGKAKRIRLFLIKRAGDIPSFLDEYSDGTLAVIAILEALFSTKDVKGPMLCLEELENCLHPAAIGKLLRFLQDNAHRWPVLITTHSPYVLNCVNPEDVNVSIPDEYGGWHFKKVRNTKKLRDYLRSGLMSFGELLPSNFEEVLEEKK